MHNTVVETGEDSIEVEQEPTAGAGESAIYPERYNYKHAIFGLGTN